MTAKPQPRYASIIATDDGLMMVSCASVEGFASTQTGPRRGSVEWAKDFLVSEGITKRRTPLKRLSAKTIAKIIEDWADAKDLYDNHECASYDNGY